MSDITVINDTQQSELVTNGLAVNGELYLKAEGSTDAGAVVVYDSGSWRTFANEYVAPSANNNELHYSGGLFTSETAPYYISTAPKMHFDASILDGADSANNPSNGSAVSVWGDRSGQATNYDGSQSTASSQPTFNVSGDDKYVSFDGGDFITLANSITKGSGEAWTIVQVGNASSSGSTYHAAPNVGSSYGSVQNGKYLNGSWYVKGAVLASGLDLSSLNVLTITRTTGNIVEVYENGNSSLGTKTVYGDFVHDTIGRSGGTRTTGNIYECMLFDSVLNSSDLNTLNSYLSNKYSGLPSLNSW